MKIGLKPSNFYDTFRADFEFNRVPVLFEVGDAHIYDILRFDGVTYLVCSISHKNDFAFVEKITINDEPETVQNDDELQCPVCGQLQSDSWEFDSEDDAFSCRHCASILSYTTELTRTFIVDVVKVCKIKDVGGDK